MSGQLAILTNGQGSIYCDDADNGHKKWFQISPLRFQVLLRVANSKPETWNLKLTHTATGAAIFASAR